MNDLIAWLGPYETYSAVAHARAQVDSPRALAYREPEESDGPRKTHRLMSIFGNVAVVKIKGSLVSGSSGYMSYYGIVGYDDIREAMTAALHNQQVQSILLDVDTQGGDVNGVQAMADFVGRVNKSGKPIITYASGNMLSAGIWAFSGGRRTFASATSELGSIGILMIHKEVTKALAKDGVKVNIIRAGRHKALANPYEELTEEAKADMEARAESLYTLFMEQVSKARGTTAAAANKAYGEGSVFVGQKAVDLGLIDQIGSLEDAFTAAVKAGEARFKKATNPGQTYGGATKLASGSIAGSPKAEDLSHNPSSKKEASMTTPMTPETIAALAAVGIDPATLAGEPEAGADAAAAQAAADAAAVAAATLAAATAAAPNVQATALATVTTMLKDTQTEAADLRVKLKAAEDKNTATIASSAGFITIARQAVTSMGVMFGVSAEAVAAMPETELLAQYGTLSAQVKAKFKVGGVSVPAASVDKPGVVKSEPLPLAFTVATTKAK